MRKFIYLFAVLIIAAIILNITKGDYSTAICNALCLICIGIMAYLDFSNDKLLKMNFEKMDKIIQLSGAIQMYKDENVFQNRIIMNLTKKEQPLDYKERMAVEFVELNERTEKLGNFFQTETFRALTDEKKSLLRRQHDAMKVYRNILHERCGIEGVPVSLLTPNQPQ